MSWNTQTKVPVHLFLVFAELLPLQLQLYACGESAHPYASTPAGRFLLFGTTKMHVLITS